MWVKVFADREKKRKMLEERATEEKRRVAEEAQTASEKRKLEEEYKVTTTSVNELLFRNNFRKIMRRVEMTGEQKATIQLILHTYNIDEPPGEIL